MKYTEEYEVQVFRRRVVRVIESGEGKLQISEEISAIVKEAMEYKSGARSEFAIKRTMLPLVLHLADKDLGEVGVLNNGMLYSERELRIVAHLME